MPFLFWVFWKFILYQNMGKKRIYQDAAECLLHHFICCRYQFSSLSFLCSGIWLFRKEDNLLHRWIPMSLFAFWSWFCPTYGFMDYCITHYGKINPRFVVWRLWLLGKGSGTLMSGLYVKATDSSNGTYFIVKERCICRLFHRSSLTNSFYFSFLDGIQV